MSPEPVWAGGCFFGDVEGYGLGACSIKGYRVLIKHDVPSGSGDDGIIERDDGFSVCVDSEAC